MAIALIALSAMVILASATVGVAVREVGMSSADIAAGSGLAVVNLKVVNSAGTPISGAFIQLERYPEGFGLPAVVDSGTTNSAGLVQLSDPTLPTYVHVSEFVHYAVNGWTANGAIVHDWSAFIHGAIPMSEGRFPTVSPTLLGGSITSPMSLTLSPEIVHGSSNLGSSSSGRSLSPDFPGGGCYPYQYVVNTWSNVWTVMGEVHSTQYETTTFSYQTNAGSSLEVMLNQFLGSGWSGFQGTGQVTVTNQMSGQTWPTQSNGQAHQAESMFNYEEIRQESVNCPSDNWYKIYSTGFDGGTNWGSVVGGDNGCPSGQWTQWLPGSQGYRAQGNGYSYTVAVTVGPVTISDTTTYNSNEEVSWVMDYGGPSYFYTYSDASSWLNVHFSSSYYC